MALALLFTFLLGGSALRAQATAPALTQVSYTEVRGEINVPLLLVHVKVNGKPATLIFDPGAQSLCLSEEVIKGLPVVGRVRTSGVGNTVATVVRAQVQIGEQTFPVIAYGQDFSVLSKTLGVHVDGILGEAVLSQFSRILIDYQQHEIIFEK